MTEWVFDAGIGERRAALVKSGRILEARIERDDDGLRAGAVVDARLNSRRLRLATASNGDELYLARLPSATEGSAIRCLVHRSAMRENDVIKRAVAHPVDPATPLTDGPDLWQHLAMSRWPVRTPAFGEDVLGAVGWDELIDEAASGIMPFPGGLLRFSLTPAMTVVDVDGEQAGTALALAALTGLAAAIRRHGIGGNIVIDLPNLPDLAARKTVAETFDLAMATAGLRCERTAINGFGLLQIICPRERPNLLERVQLAPTETAALALLRRAERAIGTGPLTLIAHPGVTAWLTARPALLAELSRRTGRATILQADPARAMDGGHAQ